MIGIGEPPTVSTASAIANAVRNATGVTMRSLPLTRTRCSRRSSRRKQEARSEGLRLRQPREREGSGRRAEDRRHRACRSAGGKDLLALMKDYIDSPGSRRQRQEASTRRSTATPDGGLRIGAAVKIVDLAEHAQVAKLYPAVVARGGRSRHAADSQPGHGRRQHQSAAALLVLPQRGVRLLQEGRLALLRRRRREPVPRDLRNDGPCHIVHPSSLAVPFVAYGAKFRVVGPNGEREIAGGRVLHDADDAERAARRTCSRTTSS